MASRLLTITLNRDAIKLTDLEYNSSQKEVTVYAAATLKTPEGSIDADGLILETEQVKAEIEQSINNTGMSAEGVIFSIQSNKIVSKEVLTPVLKDAKLKEFINTNASEYFPVNIDEYLLSHYVLETVKVDDNKQLKVMVVAIPMMIVEKYYDLAAALQLPVISLDYANNSNAQILGKQVDDSGSVVIQMGEESTTVCVFNNHVPQLIRTVPYGRSTVANAVMDKRNVTYNDALWLMTTKPILRTSFAEDDYVTNSLKYLVNNVSRIIDYFVSKNPDIPIENAVLISEEKALIGIDELLREELNIPVKLVDKLEGVELEYNLSVAVGDLTKYITNIGSVISPVNFVTAEVAEKKRKGATSRRIKIAIILGAVIAAAFIVYPSVLLVTNLAQKALLMAEIDSMENVQLTVNEYYNAKDKYTDISQFAGMATTNNDYLDEFIEFLEKEMPSDISASNLNVNNGSVTMSCTGRSKDTLASFIDTVKKQPNIYGVNVGAFSEVEGASGGITISYTITFTFGDFQEETEENTDEDVAVDENKEAE